MGLVLCAVVLEYIYTQVKYNFNINVSGISLADDSTTTNNTTIDSVETLKTDNINKNNSLKSDEEYLSLNDGLEFAYQSADQTASNEESLVKDTELSVDELRAQMAML